MHDFYIPSTVSLLVLYFFLLPIKPQLTQFSPWLLSATASSHPFREQSPKYHILFVAQLVERLGGVAVRCPGTQGGSCFKSWKRDLARFACSFIALFSIIQTCSFTAWFEAATSATRGCRCREGVHGWIHTVYVVNSIATSRVLKGVKEILLTGEGALIVFSFGFFIDVQ